MTPRSSPDQALQLSTDYDRSTAMSRLVKLEMGDGFVDDAIQSISLLFRTQMRGPKSSGTSGAFCGNEESGRTPKRHYQKQLTPHLEIKNVDSARARQVPGRPTRQCCAHSI